MSGQTDRTEGVSPEALALWERMREAAEPSHGFDPWRFVELAKVTGGMSREELEKLGTELTVAGLFEFTCDEECGEVNLDPTQEW